MYLCPPSRLNPDDIGPGSKIIGRQNHVISLLISLFKILPQSLPSQGVIDGYGSL